MLLVLFFTAFPHCYLYFSFTLHQWTFQSLD